MKTTGEDTSSYAVYFTKGLGDVVRSELQLLVPQSDIGKPGDRFLIATATKGEMNRVQSEGRTFDDIRLLVAGPQTILDEAAFDDLCAHAASVTQWYLEHHDPERVSHEPWSVTMSALAPVWRGRPSWDPGDVIKKRFAGADLRAKSRAAVDLRLQVDRDHAHVSLNLVARPHGKLGAAPARLGALRASVAASLVRLALEASDPSVVPRGLYDPCCGTGTILAEALRLSLPVHGSDIEAGAVAITTERLTAITKADAETPPWQVFHHDLLRGIPGRVNAKIVASNLPWGKQVNIPRRGELFDLIAALAARGLAEGGATAVLTTHEQQLLGRLRRHAPRARVTTRRIGLLGQTPAVVLVRP